MLTQRSVPQANLQWQSLPDEIGSLSASIATLIGPSGLGQHETVRAAFVASNRELIEVDGDWNVSGYLGGFEELVSNSITWAEAHAPYVVTKHEQTLKRIFPTRSSSFFRTPKDLTNTADREERTRFYHFEYQNKLLVGLAEFIFDVLDLRGAPVALLIDNAGRLSPTSRNLVSVFARKDPLGVKLQFVLLDTDGSLFLPEARKVVVPIWDYEEFCAHLAFDGVAHDSRERIYRLSGGSLLTAQTLLTCVAAGIRPVGTMSLESVIDLYLSTLDSSTKLELALTFFNGASRTDKIAQRNALTFRSVDLDHALRKMHREAVERFRSGNGPLIAFFALSIGDRHQRLEALVDICEILMQIGLYDSWFVLFAEYFNDEELRLAGDGNGRVLGLFINAAFVLYAMGDAAAATPFLKQFIERYPESRFVPTALYAQSMIYGRYQVPVDLDRAEECAVRNLAIIDNNFTDNRKFRYIRVFAENAYAYIKARQGRFAEALEICERGNTEIVAEYGNASFVLHRSILIYNTSQIYEFVGDWQKAELQLKAAMALDPYYAEYHNDLANLLSRQPGRQHEALEAYERAIELSPPYYEAYLNRGMLRVELGMLDWAVEDFKRVLDIKPEEWRAFRELANVRSDADDFHGALLLYKQALAFEQNDADLHANLGLVLSHLGERELAIIHYRRAIALNASHAQAQNNLGIELVEAGELDGAREHIAAAFRTNADPEYGFNLEEVERRLRVRGADH
ncbi:tetratricopeptide repeat protein [Rhizobium leguminosarum]|uniref:tetratricopeptide repeat protein n=2 Tax=Rhizobium leguminosarum TaxID=384 RepID=UPI001C91B448|nr:tetratricopeptide repeat protein [Rhizobium leguminosarum]MBY2937518.1 tetratricopeptide repeat protein [Rhizobium leguminosarum]